MKTNQTEKRSCSRKQRTLESASYRELAESVLLQPWFLPKRVAFAMHSLVPHSFWLRMRNAFEDYGCLICEKRSHYHSNGMCSICFGRTRKRILVSARYHAARHRNARLDLELFRQQNLAKSLLRNFGTPQKRLRSSRKMRITKSNPVYEALAAKMEHERRKPVQKSHTMV
jgi:hypothetical protein